MPDVCKAMSYALMSWVRFQVIQLGRLIRTVLLIPFFLVSEFQKCTHHTYTNLTEHP